MTALAISLIGIGHREEFPCAAGIGAHGAIDAAGLCEALRHAAVADISELR